jgi:probable rRNA maturation factor
VAVKLYLRNATRNSGLDMKALRADINALMAGVDEADSSLSLSFVRDAEIRELNRLHRGKDSATDVLSFPLEPDEGDEEDEVERLIGDIVISVDVAAKQAAEYDADLQTEVRRLLIHGILHLLGHDHMEPEERAVMEAEERRLADIIGMPWPYLTGTPEEA